MSDGERIPDLIDGISTDDTVGEFDSMSKRSHFFHDEHTLCGNLRAYAVARQYRYFKNSSV